MREAYEFLGTRNVLAPASDFYAIEPFTALGLRDENALRMGVAPYTDESDVERLLDGLREWLG
jgi:selenocysteine lyase/cysteine desulfurase